MPYITSVEQIGYDRGIEEEMRRSLERERSLVMRRLDRKIGSTSELLIARINTLSLPQLEFLGDALLDFGSIADLTKWLDNQG